MNPAVLAQAHPHIRSEWHRQKRVNRVIAAALSLAAASYRKGVAPEDLPGHPPADDAPLADWIDYFIGQGVQELHSPLFHPEDLVAAVASLTEA